MNNMHSFEGMAIIVEGAIIIVVGPYSSRALAHIM